ncbi:hypothetical protein D7Z54_26695 [Salibacterium salarium]|uniref:Uncharacterized protein n=1 Tax=Salibacterium salarium TaxID=284579 RepID=A0A428MW35_9BACI|nr:hypothetical protein D7Z54_26695 [Salibacterium salarium]
MKNEGSLDIGSVLLDTSFEVDESDFANYILVTISKSDSNQSPGNGKGPDGKGPPGLGNKPSHSPKDKNIIKNIPLHELEEQEQELLEGIDDSEKLTVTFEFEKTEDQNHLQGETLTFDWIFKAMQTDGEER